MAFDPQQETWHPRARRLERGILRPVRFARALPDLVPLNKKVKELLQQGVS